MNSLCEQVSLHLAYPEDGGSIILRKVDTGVQIYAARCTKMRVCKVQGRKSIHETKCSCMVLVVWLFGWLVVGATTSSGSGPPHSRGF